MSARNRELVNLVLAAIVARRHSRASRSSARTASPPEVSATSRVIVGLYLVAHVVARLTVPDADPTLLPLVALLTAIGLTVDLPARPRGRPTPGRLGRGRGRSRSRSRSSGFASTTASSSATSTSSGSRRSCCCCCRRCRGSGQRVNGVKLWINVGRLQFQPGELAKIFLIIFLAGYLRDKREALAQGRLKDLGPLLAIWGAAMLVLVQTSDLGSALLNFGIFLAMVYVATGRALYVVVGLALFVAGSAALYNALGRVQQRVTVWLHPWTDEQGLLLDQRHSSTTARTATRTSSSRASTRSRTAATAAPGSAGGRSRRSTGRS